MDQITTVSEITDVSMELILSIVQTELKEQMVLAPTLTDYSALVGPGMKSVKVPRAVGEFDAEKKLSATKFTSQSLSFSSDAISLDEHRGVLAEIENIASLQANIDLVGEYARRMASELALKMDEFVFEKMKLTSASSPDHRRAFDNGSTLGKNDFVLAKKLLRQANVPTNDGRLFMAISPERESDILKLADFVDADKWGDQAVAAKLNGVIGRAYGFNIVVSNTVEDNACIAYHSSHVAWAQQMAPVFRTQPKLSIAGFEALLDHLYGAQVMDLGVRGVLLGSAS